MSDNLKLVDQTDLTIPIGSEVAFKALMDMMERPFCALGKKPRFKPIHYKKNNVEILITSSLPWGIATIYDMDIMIWFASRITNKLNKSEKVSPVIEFTPYDCLKSLGRETSGINYRRFEAALNRLFNTRIITSIRVEDQIRTPGVIYTRKEMKGFHWIESYNVEEETKSGKKKVRGFTVVLPEWFLAGLVKRNLVLQLAPEYFDLKSGLDKALYLIARKHVGRQAWWSFTMRQLYEKTGSDSPYRNFIINVKKSVERNLFPEYVMTLEGETVHFYYRHLLSKKNQYWEPKRINGKLPD